MPVSLAGTPISADNPSTLSAPTRGADSSPSSRGTSYSEVAERYLSPSFAHRTAAADVNRASRGVEIKVTEGFDGKLSPLERVAKYYARDIAREQNTLRVRIQEIYREAGVDANSEAVRTAVSTAVSDFEQRLAKLSTFHTRKASGYALPRSGTADREGTRRLPSPLEQFEARFNPSHDPLRAQFVRLVLVPAVQQLDKEIAAANPARAGWLMNALNRGDIRIEFKASFPSDREAESDIPGRGTITVNLNRLLLQDPGKAITHVTHEFHHVLIDRDVLNGPHWDRNEDANERLVDTRAAASNARIFRTLRDSYQRTGGEIPSWVVNLGERAIIDLRYRTARIDPRDIQNFENEVDALTHEAVSRRMDRFSASLKNKRIPDEGKA